MTDPTEPAPPGRRLDPLLVCVAGVVTGIAIVAAHMPRAGMYVIAGSLGWGAAVRLLLRPRVAGSLVVRSRYLDAIVLAALAVAIATLAAVTPLHGAG